MRIHYARGKFKIRTGQKWRSKTRNFILIVGSKLRDNHWKVFTPSMKRGHEMEESSFKFFTLIED